MSSERRRIVACFLGGTIASVAPVGGDGPGAVSGVTGSGSASAGPRGAGTPGADAAGVVPALSARELLASIGAVPPHWEVEPVDFRRTSSGDLTFADILELAALLEAEFAAEADGGIVVQGTDTIEETSYLLDLVLTGSAPVVVTGAMVPPDRPGADGPQNLMDALTVAASPQARDRGCLVVLNGEVHAARHVRKTHTSSTDSFRSVSGPQVGTVRDGEFRPADPSDASTGAGPDATASPGAGSAGPHRRTADRTGGESAAPAPVSPRLALGAPPTPVTARVGMLWAGFDPGLEQLHHARDAGYQGLVVQGLGGGHVPSAWVPDLAALAADIPVILATRVPEGAVLTDTYGFPGSELDLISRGLIPSGTLGPAKARILLTLLLAHNRDRPEIEQTFADAGAQSGHLQGS